MLILMAQLVVTFVMFAIFTCVDSVRLYTSQTPGLFWAALILSIVCLIALSCCGSIRRRHPQNIIFLGIFTVITYNHVNGLLTSAVMNVIIRAWTL